MTQDEKLDDLMKRVKHIERSQNIHTLIIVAGFLGIFSLASFVANIKKKI